MKDRCEAERKRLKQIIRALIAEVSEVGMEASKVFMLIAITKIPHMDESLTEILNTFADKIVIYEYEKTEMISRYLLFWCWDCRYSNG